jgi:hypothetical protein
MMLRVLSSSAALFVSLVHGYANPGSCSGSCNVHDPSLIQRSSDGTYFRFSTGNKISYASASSIKGPWTAIGSVVPAGSSIDLDGNDDLWVSDNDVPQESERPVNNLLSRPLTPSSLMASIMSTTPSQLLDPKILQSVLLHPIL